MKTEIYSDRILIHIQIEHIKLCSHNKFYTISPSETQVLFENIQTKANTTI